ncbi:hypothetical protein FRB95_008837 [Tulasnella sp. JGI-2019a]|nr:hypothetical protein FRB93_007426 [Tulasnella sp. JGI-2019a]KAG9026465.1 hypothetical protein FRB95_008837 [Tulasnella sp. JGI-2019a]
MDYNTLTKDPDYYFPDGNICIAVDQVLFRVTQSALARQSTIFCDMLKLSEPTDGSESLEGAAVVRLSDGLDEIRTLFMFMHGDIPLKPSFDMIDRALRISHKYEANRLYAWGLSHLRGYPNANSERPAYFGKKEYMDPDFLARLIQLTQLLDRRELDGHAALAYYSLSTINWKLHDPKPIFHQLDAETISRLASGRSNILPRCLNIINGIVKHRCMSEATTKRPAREEERCQAEKDAVLDVLVPNVGGDFVTALSRCPATGTCRLLASLITKGLADIHGSIFADFGFSHT